MSAASCLLSEYQFLCSLCLDVFTDPVSIPCGHSFCKSCITKHWDWNCKLRLGSCECPNCKKTFAPRPELNVNTFVSEMTAQFKLSAPQTASGGGGGGRRISSISSSISSISISNSGQQAAKPGEVPCDICTGTQAGALKTCLVCLVSYCETHLEPHLKLPGLRKHQLVNPVENLQGRTCATHDKLLELYCSDDRACICVLCALLDHAGHVVAPVEGEYARRKAKLTKTLAGLLDTIVAKRVNVQRVKLSVEVSRRIASREKLCSARLFAEMKGALQRKQADVMEVIEDDHRRTELMADGFVADLRRDISDLEWRSAGLEQLSNAEDPLNLLQNFPSVDTLPSVSTGTLTVPPPPYEGKVSTAVTRLMEGLRREMEQLFPREDAGTRTTRTTSSHKQQFTFSAELTTKRR